MLGFKLAALGAIMTLGKDLKTGCSHIDLTKEESDRLKTGEPVEHMISSRYGIKKVVVQTIPVCPRQNTIDILHQMVKCGDIDSDDTVDTVLGSPHLFKQYGEHRDLMNDLVRSDLVRFKEQISGDVTVSELIRH